MGAGGVSLSGFSPVSSAAAQKALKAVFGSSAGCAADDYIVLTRSEIKEVLDELKLGECDFASVDLTRDVDAKVVARVVFKKSTHLSEEARSLATDDLAARIKVSHKDEPTFYALLTFWADLDYDAYCVVTRNFSRAWQRGKTPDELRLKITRQDRSEAINVANRALLAVAPPQQPAAAPACANWGTTLDDIAADKTDFTAPLSGEAEDASVTVRTAKACFDLGTVSVSLITYPSGVEVIKFGEETPSEYRGISGQDFSINGDGSLTIKFKIPPGSGMAGNGANYKFRITVAPGEAETAATTASLRPQEAFIIITVKEPERKKTTTPAVRLTGERTNANSGRVSFSGGGDATKVTFELHCGSTRNWRAANLVVPGLGVTQSPREIALPTDSDYYCQVKGTNSDFDLPAYSGWVKFDKPAAPPPPPESEERSVEEAPKESAAPEAPAAPPPHLEGVEF